MKEHTVGHYSSHPDVGDRVSPPKGKTRVSGKLEGVLDKIAPVKEEIVHPKHYNMGKIECWDYLVSHGFGFLDGNVIKYITRFRYKHGLPDLLKAREYLNKLIATVEAEERGKPTA